MATTVDQVTTDEVATDQAIADQATTDRRWYESTIAKVLARIAVPLVLIIIWALVKEADLVDDIFLPSPGGLWDALKDLGPILPEALWSSISMTLAGFTLGTILGVALGLSLAYSRPARWLFGDLLDFLRPVPIFAMIPLFVLWFGIGFKPGLLLITLGVFVILGTTTFEAVKNVAPVYVRAALTLGASRRRIYRTVVVPAICPNMVGALRVAAAAAWGLNVAAEFIGAQSGLGYTMILRSTYLDTAGIIAIVLIYCTLAISFDLFLRWATVPLLRWSDRSSREGIAAAILGRS